MGNLYVADTGNNRVLKVEAGTGTQISLGSNLNSPLGVAVDAAGDVFIADTGNNQVVEITFVGLQTTVASGLNAPGGVAVDAAGDVYIANTGTNNVLEVRAGSTVAVPVTAATQFSHPMAIAVNAAGDLFVADTLNQRVVKLAVSQAPALTFANTGEGATSNPQSVTVANIGNSALTISAITVGANFAQVAGSGTPADCASGSSFTLGADCNLSIDFQPVTTGVLASSAALTDNAGNAAGTTQSIALTGTGLLAQTISFGSIGTQAVGTPLTLSATASSGLAVTFSSSTTSVCTVTGSVVTFVAGGTCSIVASQAGNASYAPAPTVTRSFAVSAGLTTLVSLSPNAGSGSPQAFTAVVSDPNGAGDLNAIYLLFNSSVSAANGCYVLFEPQSNQLYLKNDAGTANLGPLTPGVAGQVTNSTCTLAGTGSSYTPSGNTAKLTLELSFASTAVNNVYLYAADKLSGNTGFVQKGNWGISLAAPVINSLSPSGGSGASQAFTTLITDLNGAADLNGIDLLINTSVTGAHGCYVLYSPTSNQLFLKNDAGTANLGPLTPGVAGEVSNSQCGLAGTGSSYTTLGNSGTLTVAVTFTVTEPQYIYVYASDKKGVNSGFVKKGTWGVSAGLPSAVSVSPNSGSGATQTFSAVFTDPNGAGDLTTLEMLFNTKVAAAHACYVTYSPVTNELYLTNDADTGQSAGITLGTSATVSNSQCTVAAAGSSYTTSGNTATLNVELTFTGTKPANIYLYAGELMGSNTGWVKRGLWGVSAGAPSIVSLTPTSGSGVTQSFTAVFSDPNGTSDMSTLSVLINTQISGTHACYVTYNPVTNEMYLTNDADSAQLPGVTPGSTATAANSQCTLAGTGSSYTNSGNAATLTLALTFTGTTATNVYLDAAEINGSSTGWVKEGNWTP